MNREDGDWSQGSWGCYLEQVEEQRQGPQGQQLGHDAQDQADILPDTAHELGHFLAHPLQSCLPQTQHDVEGSQVFLHGRHSEHEGTRVSWLHAWGQKKPQGVSAENMQQLKLLFCLDAGFQAATHVLFGEVCLAGGHTLVGQLAHGSGRIGHQGQLGGVSAVQHLPTEVKTQEAGIDAREGLAGRRGGMQEVQGGTDEPAVGGQEAGSSDLMVPLQIPGQHLHQVVSLSRRDRYPPSSGPAVWLVEAELEVELLEVCIGEATDLSIAAYVLAGDAADGRGPGGHQNAGLGRAWWRVKKDPGVLIASLAREESKGEDDDDLSNNNSDLCGPTMIQGTVLSTSYAASHLINATQGQKEVEAWRSY